ncbi:GRB2-associated-binding protein 2-like isoform X2 [Marmota marmota marmota]|uniref:GRB2-associated-binding protein 2-like isoform X2 n=1 Tax=Marmota marmota marmota TaxID=9994 RepID=UPI0020921578|nr:GRB2-associated-binding protein 2-like isoform X2 [Marmota marmota marmota]
MPGGFMFIVQTRDHTFYLVAETKEDMHKWVQSICQACGFWQEVESKASFPEACNHSPWGTERAGTSAESRSLGASFHQPAGVDVSHLNKASSEDDYLPMSTVFSTLQDMEGAGGNSQNVHNRRNPRNLQFGSHNCPPEALSLHKGQVRGSHIQPPVVNRSLKPGWQAAALRSPAPLRNCAMSLHRGPTAYTQKTEREYSSLL